jgi:two-component system sensor histidine kinase YesM
VKSYVNILTLRYGEDISTRFMIPDELLFYKVPNMMIQPIIENAYMHAFQNKKENGKDYFSGIGIKNVNERIQLLYGQDYGVHIHSIIGSGTTVTIVLPLLE